MTNNKGPFNASDLPVVENERIYHLDIKSEELAHDIIIVGDPGRTISIADEFFEKDYFERYHRGLRTITGYTKDKGHRVSLVTSGMGTPSLEIVTQEIVALNELILKTKKRKENWDDINIIRVGTSGGLQKETELGLPMISEYAVGMDSTGLHYNVPYPDENCKRLETELDIVVNRAIPDGYRFKGKIHPYVTKASPKVVKVLEWAANKHGIEYGKGITVSNAGFFANQGRDIARVGLTIPDIDALFAEYNPGINKLRFENMEMESSFLFHFMGGLGYNVGAICPAIANRREDTFATKYDENINNATKMTLDALYSLRRDIKHDLFKS